MKVCLHSSYIIQKSFHFDDFFRMILNSFIDESSLIRLLKSYGSLKSNARHVTSAIFEARFMNYKFKTVRELHEVMNQAAKHALKDHSDTDPKFVSELLMKTMVALRMFVNDELNQLDYAIRFLAVKYLKMGGVLAIITHNPAEEKVVQKCFKELSLESVDLDHELTEKVSLDFTRKKIVKVCLHFHFILTIFFFFFFLGG